MKEKIVCIEWDDAAYNSGYYDKKYPEDFEPVFTRTVGHLIRSTKKTVLLASDRFYDVQEKKPEDDRHISIIPKKMIRKIIVLGGKDAVCGKKTRE